MYLFHFIGTGGMMKKDTHIILVVCLIFLFGAVFLFYQGQKGTVLTDDLISSKEYTDTSGIEAMSSEQGADLKNSPDADKDLKEEHAVYISGAVRHPGIYRYYGKKRIYDAIEALGGFKKNAAKESVNLAKFLTDGEQIQVLTKKQAEKQDDQNGQGASGDALSSGLMNINQAGKEELMTLPGIGEAKAMLIINYRIEHGSFVKIEDLMKISGIKKGIYEKIKALITV